MGAAHSLSVNADARAPVAAAAAQNIRPACRFGEAKASLSRCVTRITYATDSLESLRIRPSRRLCRGYARKIFHMLNSYFFAALARDLRAFAPDARANVIASARAGDFTESPVSSAFLRCRRISLKTLVRICLLTRSARAARSFARNIWCRLRRADAPSCESALIFRLLV